MISSPRHVGLSLLSSALFVLGFPLMVYLVRGGELFGAFMIVPLTLIGLDRGQQGGIAAAVIGIGFTEAVFNLVHFLVRHMGMSSYWFIIVIAPALVFLFVGFVVGKLGDTIRVWRGAEAALIEQEKRHHAVIQNLAMGVAISDPKEEITFANPQAEMIFGTEKGGLVGQNLRDFLSDPEFARIRAETGKRSRGETSSYEIYIRRPNGEMRHTQVTAAPQYDAAGKFAGALATFQDITEHMELRRRLDEERAQLQTLINNLPDAVYLKDTESRFMLANPALAEMMNAGNSRNLIGKTDHDFYPKEEADEYLADERKLIEERAILSNKREPKTVTGSLRWIATTKAPIIGSDGKVRGLVGISRDITERVQAEEQLAHERALMQTLMDSSADYIWFKDLDSRFVLANKATARHLDVADPAELIGKTDFDFFAQAHAKAAFEDEKRIIESGQAIIDLVERETWPNKPDRWVSTTKMPLRDTRGQIVGTFGISRDITERRNMEESLRESEEHYRNTFMNAPFGFFHSTVEGKLLATNPAFSRMMGYDSPEELTEAVNQKSVADVLYLVPQKRPGFVMDVLAAGGKWYQFQNQYRTKDGKAVNARVTLRRYQHASASTAELEGIVEDLTEQERAEAERNKLQAQLLQAQKMEAVGRLAGGIAHDFNNILTAIYGYCDAGLLTTTEREPLFRQIRQAAERAANLTSRLLAFSKGHAFQPRTLDLGELVAGMGDMVRRLVGEDVEVNIRREEGLWSLRADPAQVEQVIMNLVVNSRDAMPKGGMLTIETTNARLGADYVREHLEVKEGEYVMLTVSDTGQGMDAVTLERIYEPFFTTKEIGKGTGLGLATVYGIVKHSGGYIYCDSEVGKGTTFKVYFPRTESVTKASEAAREQPTNVGGSEPILFVDDDDAVRTIAVSVLEAAGYKVTSAESGAQALAMAPSFAVAPKLLITDVVMPGLGGVETARRLAERFPGMRVLYISGHTEDAILGQGLLQESVELLQKPFAATDLLRRVKKVLDG